MEEECCARQPRAGGGAGWAVAAESPQCGLGWVAGMAGGGGLGRSMLG